MSADTILRDRISVAVTESLKPLPAVYAGWEGGSAAFDSVDEYSDIDLTFLVSDDASFEDLFASAESALKSVSRITASYSPPLGRYYKLADGSDYLFVDLVFLRAGEPDHYLEVERHGQVKPLFDKADWLRRRPLDHETLGKKRERRYRELQTWFPISQVFVRKAILRDRQVEAVAAFWAYTLRPLVELVRMRYCPVRWDFGMRYLDRDLPPEVYRRVQELVFVSSREELERNLASATSWGIELLREVQSDIPQS